MTTTIIICLTIIAIVAIICYTCFKTYCNNDLHRCIDMLGYIRESFERTSDHLIESRTYAISLQNQLSELLADKGKPRKKEA